MALLISPYPNYFTSLSEGDEIAFPRNSTVSTNRVFEMKPSNLFSGLSLILLLGVFLAPATAQEKVNFEKQIKPIFENYCLSCHIGDEAEGFELDDRGSTLDYIEAGDAENSTLYEVLISDDEDTLMPPADAEKPLTAAQIALIKTWIDEGAEWPEEVKLVLPPDVGDDTSENDANATADGEEGEKPAKDKEAEKMNQTIFNAIGSLHPAVLHIPMGLLLAAGLFALLGIRGNFVMSDCAYYCMWLGVLGSIVACVTGWWFTPMENRGTVESFNDLFDQNKAIFMHRISALIVTIVGLILALFAAAARAKDPDDGVLWKLGLIVLAFAKNRQKIKKPKR